MNIEEKLHEIEEFDRMLDEEIEIDEDVTICCFRECAFMVKMSEAETGDITLIYENPANGRWYRDVKKATEGWLDLQSEEEQSDWNYLIEKILNDETLYKKVEKKTELIEY